METPSLNNYCLVIVNGNSRTSRMELKPPSPLLPISDYHHGNVEIQFSTSPVCLARLPDVGLEERSDGIADERVKGLVGGVLAQGQHAHLCGDGLVRVDNARPLDEGQAGQKKVVVSTMAQISRASISAQNIPSGINKVSSNRLPVGLDPIVDVDADVVGNGLLFFLSFISNILCVTKE